MTGSDTDRDEGGEPFDQVQDGSSDEALELQETSDELALEDNERLPWLDADDDDDYSGETSSGRIFGLVVLGLIALATIVGGIWWSTHRNPDPTLVADGSTLPPPGEPYKEAPKDPGGKTFEGTGNTAFAVSEGQTRPAKLGEAAPSAAAGSAPRPGFDIGKAPAASGTPAPAKTAPAATPAAPAPASGAAVQVGAYSSQALAEAAWGRLTQRYTVLSGQRYRIVEGQADIGTVFRLQVLPGDANAAQSLCLRLKSSGLPCQVK